MEQSMETTIQDLGLGDYSRVYVVFLSALGFHGV